MCGGGQASPSEKRKRAAGLDIVRCFAVLFVIAVHFFLHSGFNSEVFEGWQMFVLSMGQTLFLINVPLFLILTGYLNLNKKVSKAYYKNGIRVIVSYLVISVVTILFRKYYMHEDLSWVRWILKITDFSAIPYGWYIEMWIGLFVLTPFLNTLWHAIESRRHRELLILTLYLLCALPDFCNRYGVHLMPGYWVSIYPVCYFYIGAYIKDYQPNVKKLWLWGGILALCLINPVANVLIVHGRPMMHLIGGPGGLAVIPLAALFFMAFYRMDVANHGVKSVLAKVSVLSLDMYLISAVFDMLYYPILKGLPWMSSDYLLLLFFMVVLLVFFSSFVFALCKSVIGNIITRR